MCRRQGRAGGLKRNHSPLWGESIGGADWWGLLSLSPLGGVKLRRSLVGGTTPDSRYPTHDSEKLAEGFDRGILQVTEPTEQGQFRIRPHIHL